MNPKRFAFNIIPRTKHNPRLSITEFFGLAQRQRGKKYSSRIEGAQEDIFRIPFKGELRVI